MAKLSKQDQKVVNLATLHAVAGNKESARRIINSALRSANNRSRPLLFAELAKLN